MLRCVLNILCLAILPTLAGAAGKDMTVYGRAPVGAFGVDTLEHVEGATKLNMTLLYSYSPDSARKQLDPSDPMGQAVAKHKMQVMYPLCGRFTEVRLGREIGATDATIPVVGEKADSVMAFPESGYLMIEGERIEYTTRTAEKSPTEVGTTNLKSPTEVGTTNLGTFAGCRRGAGGTQAASHGAGLLLCNSEALRKEIAAVKDAPGLWGYRLVDDNRPREIDSLREMSRIIRLADRDVQGLHHAERDDNDARGLHHAERDDYDVQGLHHAERDDYDAQGLHHAERDDNDAQGLHHAERDDYDVQGLHHAERDDYDDRRPNSHIIVMGIGGSSAMANFDAGICDALGVYPYPYHAGKLDAKTRNQMRFIMTRARALQPDIGLIGIYQAFAHDESAQWKTMPTAEQVREDMLSFYEWGADGVMAFIYHWGGNNKGLDAVAEVRDMIGSTNREILGGRVKRTVPPVGKMEWMTILRGTDAKVSPGGKAAYDLDDPAKLARLVKSRPNRLSAEPFEIEGRSYPLKVSFPAWNKADPKSDRWPIAPFAADDLTTTDWSRARALEQPIYNPGEQTIVVLVSLEDTAKGWWQRSVEIPPHVPMLLRVPMDEASLAVDPGHIQRYLLWEADPPAAVEFRLGTPMLAPAGKENQGQQPNFQHGFGVTDRASYGNSVAVPDFLVLDDPLQGATSGTRAGGVFVTGGWQVTGRNDSIYWHVPTITKGAVEFDVRGLHPNENRAGMEDKTELFHMYDHTAGEADVNYTSGTGGYRDNPFKHFIRKIGALDAAKADAMEIVWLIRPRHEEPDTARLAWDPAATYHFREEWGPDGAGPAEVAQVGNLSSRGRSVLKLYRDGQLLITTSVPGAWNPAGHTVRIGASPRRDPTAGAPLGAVFSNLKVWDLASRPNVVR